MPGPPRVLAHLAYQLFVVHHSSCCASPAAGKLLEFAPVRSALDTSGGVR